MWKGAGMNENAIDRNLVCAFIAGLISDDGEREKGLEYIRSMPPVNPQLKTGHWIPIQKIIGVDKEGNEISATVGYKCSKCLIVHPHTSIFCPSCGAKMVEPQESEEV
jgi:hypothetical protein